MPMRPLLLELTCLKRSIYGTRTRRSNRSVPMCNCAGWACHGHALNGRVGDDAEAGRGVCVATESDKKRARKTRCRWTLSRSDGWPLQGLIVRSLGWSRVRHHPCACIDVSDKWVVQQSALFKIRRVPQAVSNDPWHHMIGLCRESTCQDQGAAPHELFTFTFTFT